MTSFRIDEQRPGYCRMTCLLCGAACLHPEPVLDWHVCEGAAAPEAPSAPANEEAARQEIEAEYRRVVDEQRRRTLTRLILSRVGEGTRTAAEVEELLASLPPDAWPCGGCPEKVYAFIATVLDDTYPI